MELGRRNFRGYQDTVKGTDSWGNLEYDTTEVLALAYATSGDPRLFDAMVAAADRSLLVLRPCYLALRRAVSFEVRPTGVVLVAEAGRAITAPDVEDALGVPVVAEVLVTDAIARAVDAGLLASRLPRSLVRDLRAVA